MTPGIINADGAHESAYVLPQVWMAEDAVSSGFMGTAVSFAAALMTTVNHGRMNAQAAHGIVEGCKSTNDSCCSLKFLAYIAPSRSSLTDVLHHTFT